MDGGANVRSLAEWRANTNFGLVGSGAAMAALREEIALVARCNTTVLITGESGVGKGLVAREIYSESARASNVFAVVNCVGLSATVLESALFGQAKAGSVGRGEEAPGKLQSARNGTVFLDEIGEMPQRVQVKLLRFLETGEPPEAEPTNRRRHDNVRVLAATKRSLRTMMTQNTFCQDLFYRTNVIHVAVPPLRERREDIPALVNHFLDRHVRLHRLPTTTVSTMAMTSLAEYSWPGCSISSGATTKPF